MIEIQNGTNFKQQEEIADSNLSLLLNPNSKNKYGQIQREILRRINEWSKSIYCWRYLLFRETT